ncbi:MAG: AAA family ATPase [Deltaproteobacteria bacterium]|nr:AAA family ATPase [Deltaproteobacteria bacterium]
MDIPVSMAEDLILRYLYAKGASSLRELGRSVKLSFPLLHTLFQRMRQQQLFEITGMDGNDYMFTLSGIGREQAAKRFLVCHYIGPAPVSVSAYNAAVCSQNIRLAINHTLLKMVLADLVLTDRFLDELGPALISQKSIFLYGPTGNGKTSVVSRLSRLHQDTIVIPYAVEVDGQVIVLYDPAVHEIAEAPLSDLDQRWVVCRRPCIIVGGELEPSMLELQLEESSKVYAAPIQMRANNGMLVIDDFGRQIVSPMHLLNRWIVPLDRRVDYLTLRYGLKFQIPFELTVVFATNLDPNDLADEAFLRRIPNKILVDAVDCDSFDRIFARVVKERRLSCDPATAIFFRNLCVEMGGGLRACQPADVLNALESISEFEGNEPRIDPKSLTRAAGLYFAKPKGVSAPD